jgi:hypothetical protein
MLLNLGNIAILDVFTLLPTYMLPKFTLAFLPKFGKKLNIYTILANLPKNGKVRNDIKVNKPIDSCRKENSPIKMLKSFPRPLCRPSKRWGKYQS